ncbi:flagellar biosynthesis anti-sigma factor FlgM [Janthinobacterium sp. RB2R34]|uniref:flagellar biosynthesis anti-sigma factor FlgM n=1 Tax=Janthinobacterium sp. RB2R34 TaxID=3424193 RepID=UPI003F1FB9D7
MKISTGNAGAAAASPAVAPAEAIAEYASAAAAAGGSSAGAELQSAVLQPAITALRAMPDIDHERVAMLRSALAKGELPFDPAKIAGLIHRFHGSDA